MPPHSSQLAEVSVVHGAKPRANEPRSNVVAPRCMGNASVAFTEANQRAQGPHKAENAARQSRPYTDKIHGLCAL